LRDQASTLCLNPGLVRRKSLPMARAFGAQRSPVRRAGDLWGPREGDQPLRRFFSALAAENFAALLAEI
jgi:hypothetical protein